MATIALLAFSCAACTSTIAGVASTTTAAPSGIVAVDDRATRSDAWLADATAPNRPGCSAAAAVDGQVMWADAAGLADLSAGAPLSTATRFELFGVSDQFVATAILLLAADGKLALSDPLSTHVPDLPPWADRVTLEQLLHHTSGIPEIWNLIQAGGYSAAHPAMQADAMSLLRNQDQLNFEPGQFFEGNGSNYLLLAEVVQSASGQSLPDFLRDRVFTPVQLDIDAAGEASGDVAVNYAEVLGQLQPALPDGLLVNGPGLQLGTPTDLVRWADNYRTGTVGGPELLAAVERGAMPIGPKPGVPSYGAGIFVRVDGSLEHDGWAPGEYSYYSVSPDRHTTVAFICNSEGSMDQWERMIVSLRQIWFGMP